MKLIALTQGKYALVDDADFEWLNQWKWTYHSNGYAHRGLCKNGKRVGSMFMHRQIISNNSSLDTDHINRNKLDNRKSNLRKVTRQFNSFNRTEPRHNTSGHKGVSFHNPSRKWHAYINLNYKKKHLGAFAKLKDAVRARRKEEERLGLCV